MKLAKGDFVKCAQAILRAQTVEELKKIQLQIPQREWTDEELNDINQTMDKCMAEVDNVVNGEDVSGEVTKFADSIPYNKTEEGHE